MERKALSVFAYQVRVCVCVMSFVMFCRRPTLRLDLID